MDIKRKLLSISIALLIITISYFSFISQKDQGEGIVRAFGNLLVTFPSSPMFAEVNWFPGKSVTKTVNVNNQQAALNQRIAISATNTSDDSAANRLSTALSLVISRNGHVFFGFGSPTGPKHLSDFFAATNIFLEELTAQEIANYNFVVTMDPQAGNEFQAKHTQFDLNFLSETTFPNKLITPKPLQPLQSLEPLVPLQPLGPLQQLGGFVIQSLGISKK